MQSNGLCANSGTSFSQKIDPIFMDHGQMVVVGRFGRSSGLKGGMRISVLTDFPDILCQNARFYIAYTKHILPLSHIFNVPSIFANHANTSHKAEAKSKSMSSNNASVDITDTDDLKPCYFPITLHRFNSANSVIHFREIASREDSEALRNSLFYSTICDTRALCRLSNDEFFYFDIIGMRVIENGVEIGIVQDIQEIANTYYFVLDNHFMIPYIDRYVISINLGERQIITRDARFLSTHS